MIALANIETDGARKRVSPIEMLRAIVTLRNRTKHGGVSEEEARDRTQPSGDPLLEMLGILPVLATRPPLYVRSIEKRGRGRFVVEYLQLTGTGRPPAMHRDVPDPGILDPEVIYLWGDQGDAPLQMTPLLHFHPEHDAVCMLAGFPAGTPEYRSAERGDLTHGPDKLMSEFEARASFLLGAPDSAATGTRPLAAREAYVRAVHQALGDGVVTRDEWAMLRVLRTTLGLSDAEVGDIHEECRLPPELTDVGAEPATTAGASPEPDPSTEAEDEDGPDLPDRPDLVGPPNTSAPARRKGAARGRWNRTRFFAELARTPELRSGQIFAHDLAARCDAHPTVIATWDGQERFVHAETKRSRFPDPLLGRRSRPAAARELRSGLRAGPSRHIRDGDREAVP